MTIRRTFFAGLSAVVFACGLMLAPLAQAKVMLMGNDGWEVSFDGSVNSFYVNIGKESMEGSAAEIAGIDESYKNNNSTSRITVGLLPAVFGINIKAPTMNGLDMGARIGLYPHTQNDSGLAGGRSKNQLSGQTDLREIFFTVDGSFGQVLVGKTLSLFLGKNILTDMTLFGVGAVGADGTGEGTTTSGRIGFGYVYPQFNAAIRYSTPDMNGLKATVGVYDPSPINGGGKASETTMPRFEGEISWAGNMSGVDSSAWVNGLWQEAKPNAAEATACTTADSTASCDKVNAWGFGGGLQVGFQGLTLTGSGYYGRGLGTALMLDTDSIDAALEERKNYGYIGQATYAFGQGTSIGASYGGNYAKQTAHDFAQTSLTTPVKRIKRQSLLDVMIWHDINANLRVVAEYGRQTISWNGGGSQDTNIISVGGFFFW